MAFRLLEPIALKRDLPEHRLRAGDQGTIVELHRNGFAEVEFMTAAGQTVALVTLREADMQHVEPTTHRRFPGPH